MNSNRQTLADIAASYRGGAEVTDEDLPDDEDRDDEGITGLSPTEKATGKETLKAFNLNLDGESFTEYTTITLDGVQVPTVFRSDTSVHTVMAPHKEPLEADRVVKVSTTASVDTLDFIWLATEANGDDAATE